MKGGVKLKLSGVLSKDIPDQITSEQYNELIKNGKLKKDNKKAKFKIPQKQKKVLVYNDDPSRQREFEITYKGKIYSVNEHNANHWTFNRKKQIHYKRIFAALILEAGLPAFRKIELSCRFNSRHDTVNLAYMKKWFEDTLVNLYKLEDDNTERSGEHITTPVKTLPNNTITFLIKDMAE